MVVADGQDAGDVLADGAEMPPHALTQRFERLEAGAMPGGVDADTLGTVVVDGNEDRAHAGIGSTSTSMLSAI